MIRAGNGCGPSTRETLRTGRPRMAGRFERLSRLTIERCQDFRTACPARSSEGQAEAVAKAGRRQHSKRFPNWRRGSLAWRNLARIDRGTDRPLGGDVPASLAGSLGGRLGADAHRDSPAGRSWAGRMSRIVREFRGELLAAPTGTWVSVFDPLSWRDALPTRAASRMRSELSTTVLIRAGNLATRSNRLAESGESRGLLV